ncbi:unnamed protein product, partial [Symbiodinium microadriaticum]
MAETGQLDSQLHLLGESHQTDVIQEVLGESNKMDVDQEMRVGRQRATQLDVVVESSVEQATESMEVMEGAVVGEKGHSEENAGATGTVPSAQERKKSKKDLRWRYPERLFEPLIWYFRQLEWPQVADLKAYQGEHVTWLELAVDFQAATQVELCQSGGNGEKEHAGTRAIFFASAARRMAVMCQDSLAPVDPFTNSLTPLGLPNARGFPMRCNDGLLMFKRSVIKCRG